MLAPFLLTCDSDHFLQDYCEVLAFWFKSARDLPTDCVTLEVIKAARRALRRNPNHGGLIKEIAALGPR